MSQIPIAHSLASVDHPINQTIDFGTCAVGEGGWSQSRNASIGDQWGDCHRNSIGTPNTSIDKWNDLTNVDRFSPQTAMGNHEYEVPVYKSNGANPPCMTDQPEEHSRSDKSHPAKGSSVNRWADLTKFDSNQPHTVIGDLEHKVPDSESNSASPSPTIVCECKVIYPPAKSQPTEETEGGSGSILGPTAVAAAATLLGYTVCKAVKDSEGGQRSEASPV